MVSDHRESLYVWSKFWLQDQSDSPFQLTDRGAWNDIHGHLSQLKAPWDSQATPAHLTVSAAILDMSESQLLLRFHKKVGLWIQPGGHLEGPELLFDACMREVQEETGFAAEWHPLLLTEPGDTNQGRRPIPLALHCFPVPAFRDLLSHHHLDFCFLLKAKEDMGGEAETLEKRLLRWLPLRELVKGYPDQAVQAVASRIQWLLHPMNTVSPKSTKP